MKNVSHGEPQIFILVGSSNKVENVVAIYCVCAEVSMTGGSTHSHLKAASSRWSMPLKPARYFVELAKNQN